MPSRSRVRQQCRGQLRRALGLGLLCEAGGLLITRLPAHERYRPAREGHGTLLSKRAGRLPSAVWIDHAQLVTILALGSTVGCSKSPREIPCTGHAVQSLYFGSAEAGLVRLTGAQRAAVVRVVPLPDRGVFCTGVAIGRDWVLSAGHCTSESGFRVEIELQGSVLSYQADRHAKHPSTDALLIGSDSGQMPLEVHPLALAEPGLPSLALGAPVQLAGYGETETGEPRGLQFVVSSIASISESEIIVDGGGRSGACIGDSGGPVLARDQDGAVRVLGILSSGSSSCTGRDRFLRVESLGTWVAQWVELAAPSLDCDEFPSEGECIGGRPAHCVQGQLALDACSPGQVCGWDSGGERTACIDERADECAGVDPRGRCEDDIATRCVRGVLEEQACAACGASCGRSPVSGTVECR